jgi:Icc-related predicted phosphoesterase
MRVLYAADMHGSEQVWRKFINGAQFYGADVLILGGDLTGKVLTPIVEEKPGRHVAQVFGKLERVKKERDLEELEKRLRFNGYYPYRCDADEYRRISEDEPYRMDVMRRLMAETVSRWVAVADEKLAGTTVHVYGQPGNDDESEIDTALNGEHVTNVEGQVVRVGEYQLLSSAWGNRSPWDTPREKDEDDLLEHFEAIASALEPGVPTIFNLHIPPYETGLDTGPEIAGKDEQGQVILKKHGGVVAEAPVGSKAVRALIEKYQPVLSLHSHIHESKNTAYLGRSLCINPGADYQDGVLCAALVELKGDEIATHQLVSG